MLNRAHTLRRMPGDNPPSMPEPWSRQIRQHGERAIRFEQQSCLPSYLCSARRFIIIRPGMQPASRCCTAPQRCAPCAGPVATRPLRPAQRIHYLDSTRLAASSSDAGCTSGPNAAGAQQRPPAPTATSAPVASSSAAASSSEPASSDAQQPPQQHTLTVAATYLGEAYNQGASFNPSISQPFSCTLSHRQSFSCTLSARLDDVEGSSGSRHANQASPLVLACRRAQRTRHRPLCSPPRAGDQRGAGRRQTAGPQRRHSAGQQRAAGGATAGTGAQPG